MIDSAKPNLPTVEAERLYAVGQLIAQALIDIEQIRDRPPQGLYPTYRNDLERSRDRRPFNMKDAKNRATSAAKLLREAWELADPSSKL